MGQPAFFDPIMIKKWGNREPKSSRFRGAFALSIAPHFRSLSLWFFFWKGWPDLSGFDQTESSLSFLHSWYPIPLRLTNTRTFALHIFEQLQWRQKGGLHYEETEIQGIPYPCWKQHCDPEPQSSAEHSVAGKSGHRLRGWSFAQSHVRPCQENLKTTYCSVWIKPFILFIE